MRSSIPGMQRIVLLIVLAIAIAGCTMVPRYKRPAPPVAADWPSGPAFDEANWIPSTNRDASGIGWRDFFADPGLRRVIGLALDQNRDLRIAALNVEAARAQYRVQGSALIPSVGLAGSAGRQRLPSGAVASGGSGAGSGSLTYSRYGVSVGVTDYELDLFGRIRSLKQQALESYFATDEARIAARIALVAEVANQYLAERELDELLLTTHRTLDAVTAYSGLIRTSFDLGNSTELDLRSAEAQVETARADLADYTGQRARAENALVLLVGQPLPPDTGELRSFQDTDLLADVPAGLPSDLLARRPDIRSAEHVLKAANANIGAARAAFFPRIVLTGSAGFSSTDLGSLFTSDARTWSFVPQIFVPIFDQVRNKANFDLARIRKRIEIARYEQAIQAAFREVADALAGRATLRAARDAASALVVAEQRRYDLADLRYRNGADSYLAVLTAHQDLYAAQQRLIHSHYLELANRVTLYKALGGGWKEFTSSSE